MNRSNSDLKQAIHHVQGEWMLLADMASLLPQGRDRTLAETAALESTFVHARCLINFCCGDYGGRRHKGDIQPADFLGVDWWPRDEQFDRKLRGRLPVINQLMQHLSWQRVLDKQSVIWSVVFLAHEVDWAMRLFVAELRATRSRWLDPFEMQESLVRARLPALDQPAETMPHLAPARPNPTPP